MKIFRALPTYTQTRSNLILYSDKVITFECVEAPDLCLYSGWMTQYLKRYNEWVLVVYSPPIKFIAFFFPWVDGLILSITI